MDDVTIEDQLDSSEQIISPRESIPASSSSSSLLSQLVPSWQVLIFCVCLIVGWFIARQRRQQQNTRQVSGSSSGDHADRYEQMERIRQRQQKAYEEENQRRLEAKKAKMESNEEAKKTNVTRTQYRPSDHNPLTGQSTRGDGGSCSWRPSGGRRRPAGG